MDNHLILQQLINFQQIVLDSDRPDWFLPNLGLCANFSKMTAQEEYHTYHTISGRFTFEELIEQYIHTWDKWSGCHIYPIPATRVDEYKDYPAVEYHLCVDMYGQSEYCNLRRELLAHIIECVRADHEKQVVAMIQERWGDTVLDTLLHIRKTINTRDSRRPAYFHTETGLCTNFRLAHFKLHDHEVSTLGCIVPLMAAWPKWSGSNAVPVPSNTTSPGLAYIGCRSSFYDRRTQYGRNRIELLDYMINVLTPSQS